MRFALLDAGMRVIHVFPFPGVGGTEVATRRIADAVRPFGIESSAVLLHATPDQQGYLEAAGIRCIIPDTKADPSLRHGWRFMQESHAFARHWGDADLIHCADVQAAYYVGLAGRMSRHTSNTAPWPTCTSLPCAKGARW